MDPRNIACLASGDEAKLIDDILCGHGWRIDAAATPQEVAQLIDRLDVRVAILHFGSSPPDIERLGRIEEMLENSRRIVWIAIVDRSDLANNEVTRLISGYCHDYLTLPVHPNYLLQSVGHGYGMAAIEPAAYPTSQGHLSDDGLIGNSGAMQQVRATLRKCARAGAPVAITGESGTGKELAARTVHDQSLQAKGPFIAVNCGAIPENLIQAELFGYTKGAFTGANRDKIGKIEAASGGTLFLDEIGDLSLNLQVNLLRFLQEGTIERVGSHESIAVDARIVAATHRDLEEAVANGEFREDLYYRLNVLRVTLPPLRERGDDVLMLAESYLRRFTHANGANAIGFSRQTRRLLKSHSWPGNIRELVNRIQRAVVMSNRRLLAPADLGLDRRSGSRAARTLEQARADAEKDVLQSSLSYSGNNIAEAARYLGVSRLTVYRLMEKHGMNDDAVPIH